MKKSSRFRFGTGIFSYIVAAALVVAIVALLLRTVSDKVAVLNVEGIIVSSDEYIEALKQIEEDGSFKALVVRVESPGGSVAASQEIYSFIKRLSRKMPVVASMGNVAASGGYYLACGAPVILANPGTITGSIGVIATFANYGQLLKWAKIDFEVVKTGDLKDAGSPLRALTEREREYLQGLMDGALEQFQQAVEENRKIKIDVIKKFSDGRVMLGQQAKEAGFVDEIGTLWNAIEMAAEKAGIPADSPVRHFPEAEFSVSGLLMSKRSEKLLSGHLRKPALGGSGLYYLTQYLGGRKIF